MIALLFSAAVALPKAFVGIGHRKVAVFDKRIQTEPEQNAAQMRDGLVAQVVRAHA